MICVGCSCIYRYKNTRKSHYHICIPLYMQYACIYSVYYYCIVFCWQKMSLANSLFIPLHQQATCSGLLKVMSSRKHTISPRKMCLFNHDLIISTKSLKPIQPIPFDGNPRFHPCTFTSNRFSCLFHVIFAAKKPYLIYLSWSIHRNLRPFLFGHLSAYVTATIVPRASQQATPPPRYHCLRRSHHSASPAFFRRNYIFVKRESKKQTSIFNGG